MPNAYRATKANRVRLARRAMSRTATADANWVVRLTRHRFASAEQRTAKRARNRAGAIPARIAKTVIIPTTARACRANKSLATIAKNARRTSVRHVTTDMNPIRTRVNANPKLVRRDIRQRQPYRPVKKWASVGGINPMEYPARSLAASASKKPVRTIIRQMSPKRLAARKVKAGNTYSIKNPAICLAADARQRIAPMDLRRQRRAQKAQKRKTCPTIRVIPFAKNASTAMRANNALALRDKSPTETADARAPIRARM